MTATPSSLTPRSSRKSRMSCARARSTSENMGSGAVCGGTSHPAAIQVSTACCSTRARITNSWIEIIQASNDSSLQVRAGIVVLARLPALHELFELRIEPLRQDKLEGHVFISVALVASRCAFALESQHRAGIRPFGHRHAYGAGRRGHIELRSQHGFRQTDRQFDADVVALAGEELVRLNLDLDQGIARRAAP